MKKLILLMTLAVIFSGCDTNGMDSSIMPPAQLMNGKPEQDAVESYVCYYGSYDAGLKSFDAAIIESNDLSREEIAELNEAGVYIIAYLTIGEDDSLHVGDGSGPGGMASYYFDNGGGNPLRNADWDSYYVNAGDPAWQNMIINQAAATLDKGCDGLFLDTVDTAELFPKTADGMVSLVRLIRKTFPDCKLVINRGFCILNRLAPYTDGVMFENFSSTYDFAEQTYRPLSASELAENFEIALNVINPLCQDKNLMVLTLDYCDPQNTKQITEYYNQSQSLGYVPYCSTINLDKIYIHITKWPTAA